MKKRRIVLLLGLCAIFAFALLSGPALVSADDVTIIGTVNDYYQIVTDDDEVYEVAENEQGDEVLELIGQKVKATGTVDESEETKVITVTAYEIVEE